jgi:hypothetical protein
MPDATLTDQIAAASRSPEGQFQLAMVQRELSKLDEFASAEESFPVAAKHAADLLTHGSPLCKAVVRDWAKGKGLVSPDDDKPDPDAMPPKAKEVGDGTPPPKVANNPGLATDGATPHKPAHHKAKSKHHPVIGKLKQLSMGSAAQAGCMAAGQNPEAIAAAAYQAGIADATMHHAKVTHRAMASTSRHAFQLGMRTHDPAQKAMSVADLQKRVSMRAVIGGFAARKAGQAGRFFSQAARVVATKRNMKLAAGGLGAVAGIKAAHAAWDALTPDPPAGMGRQAAPVNFNSGDES